MSEVLIKSAEIQFRSPVDSCIPYETGFSSERKVILRLLLCSL